MPDITSDQLRDISVAAVEDFLNNKVPLSRGLAKQAAAAKLNSEQIQRATEATNTIAYLKVLGMSDDRTVEFPLAKFAEVMSLITLPEKQAGWEEEKVTTNDRPEQTAPVEGADDVYPFSAKDAEDGMRGEQEKVAYFIKEAAINEKILEELEIRSLVITDQLVKQAKLIASDEKGLDKLASIADDSDYTQLTVLVTGEVKPRRDFGGHSLFKEAELKDVNKLANLFKEAKSIVAETAARSELQKRACLVSGEMTKQAGLVSGAGKAVGKAISNTVGMPFKMVGRSVHNAIGPVASKITGKPFTPAKGLTMGGALGAAGTAASVGIDAAMYSPGTDSTTGRSNDVWQALQRG